MIAALAMAMVLTQAHQGALPLKTADTRPVRILPLGDSITQGGKTDRDEYTYRWPLFQLLVEEGIEFEFVGSRTEGLQEGAAWPSEHNEVPFDHRHEGYYGIKTAGLLEKLRDAARKWPHPPDIALIHIGTNDQGAGDHRAAVAEPLRAIIGLLRRQNPRIVILLGHLNFNDSEGANAIRPLVEELARELDSPSSPVRIVHHYRNWYEDPSHPESDTFDWAHPNPRGQQKMAENWLEAIRPFLSTGD